MTDRPATAWPDIHWDAEPERPAPEIRVFRHDMMPYAQDNQAVPSYVALVFNDEAGELRLILNTFSLRHLHTTLSRVVTALDERDAPLSDADLAAAFAPIPTYPEAPPAPTPAGAAAWGAPSTWPEAGPSEPPVRFGPWTTWGHATMLPAVKLRSWMQVVAFAGDIAAAADLARILGADGLPTVQSGLALDRHMYWFAQPVQLERCGPDWLDLRLPSGAVSRVATSAKGAQVWYIAPDDAQLLAEAASWRGVADLRMGDTVDAILWKPGPRHAGDYGEIGIPHPTYPNVTQLNISHVVCGLTTAHGGTVRLTRLGEDSPLTIYFSPAGDPRRQARALHVVRAATPAC